MKHLTKSLLTVSFLILVTIGYAQDIDLVTTNGDSILDRHESRYLFFPSAFALGEGTGYYSTTFGLMHDVEFGIDNWASIRLGTSIIALPVYASVKFTIPLNERSSLALGDLAIGTLYGIFASDMFFGNLLFGQYSRRFSRNTISFTAGYWMNNDSDWGTKSSSPGISLSGQFKIGEYSYLITENYGVRLNEEFELWDEILEEYYYVSGTNLVFFGATGIRLIGKKNYNNTWQFGLVYIMTTVGDVPKDYTGPEWPAMDRDRLKLWPIPIISYSRKFLLNK